ncbi:MAG: hypothetical protein Q9159_003806 [Coniocarpon cinnabarinum]
MASISRSAADATRFTATGPSAQSYSNASPSTTRSSTINIPTSPPPPNETPQQKVERLREAARRAKAGQISTFDRFLQYGRAAADRAHRVTVVGLVSLSVICTGMAMYSLGDMMVYNRRKRREFFAEQQRNYDVALFKAETAEREGTLTPDLALVLNKERAVRQYEEEQARKGGVFKQAREWLFGGMSASAGGRLGKGGFEAEEIKRIAEGRFAEEDVGNALRQPDVRETRPELMVKEAAAVARMERETRASGGLLDDMADAAARDVSERGRSWWSWAMRR